MKRILFSEYIERYQDRLDPRFIDLLNDKMYCECGGEHAINESMTEVVCSNPNCIYKGSKRIVQMARDLQILGIGPSLAEKITEKFGITNPLLLLSYDPDADGELGEGVSMDKSVEIYKQIQEKNVPRPLWEYLRIANIPSIRDNAQKIMKDVKSFSELKSKLETEGVSFIHRQMGLSSVSTSDSVSVIKIFNNLIQEIDTLVDLEDTLNIYEPTNEITIVISKHVNGFSTKESFVDYVNTKYKGRVYLKKLNSVSKNIDFLICDEVEAGSNKVEKAYKYGINVIGSEELLNYLERNYG